MVILEIFRDVCLPLVLLIAVGWGLDRKFDLDLNTLIKLNLYLFVPAFIFHRLSSSTLEGGEGAKVIAFTLCIILAMFLLSATAAFLMDQPPQSKISMQLSTMFYNSGNWGIPLMALAFPETGPVIQVFVLMTMNISTFSVGIYLAGSFGQEAKSAFHRLLPMLRQPSIYAITGALVLRAFGNPLQDIGFVWNPLGYLADALVAFALITLGVQLSKTRKPKWERRLFAAMAIRLIGGPAIAIPLALAFGFSGETAAVLILGAASPTAVNTALLAHEFKADSSFAAAVVFATTVIAAGVVAALLGALRAGLIPWASVAA